MVGNITHRIFVPTKPTTMDTTKMTFQELQKAAKKGGYNRKFADAVRMLTGIDFTPEGIKQKYGITYYTWIKNEANKKIGSAAMDRLREYAAVCDAHPRGEAPYPKAYFEGISEVQPDKLEPEPQPQQTKGSTEAKLSFQFPQELVTEAIRQLFPDLQGDVQETIKEAAKQLQPNVVKVPGRKDVTINSKQHKQFKKAAALLNIHKQLLVAGPTGAGKTFLAGQLAKAFNLSFAHISCTAGMSEAHITGRMTGTGEYIPTSFVEAYENGGVFLFDEVDAADPNVLLLINSAIANGSLSLPNRRENPVAKRHEDFYMIVSANTWGHGSMEYAGREVLDRAFLDRFAMSRLEVDYDQALELEITEHSDLTKTLQGMRGKVDRSISTRAIIDAYKMSEAFSRKEVLEIFMADWTEEEKAKIK